MLNENDHGDPILEASNDIAPIRAIQAGMEYVRMRGNKEATRIRVTHPSLSPRSINCYSEHRVPVIYSNDDNVRALEAYAFKIAPILTQGMKDPISIDLVHDPKDDRP